MQPSQQTKIIAAQQRLSMSDGELIRLAQEIAHDANLRSISRLSWSEADELLGVLDIFERSEVERKWELAGTR